jgi:uncharacterized membrane protein YccF (DUF307 family)
MGHTTNVTVNVNAAPPSASPLAGRPGAGSTLLNIVWVLLAGLPLAIAYVMAGLFQCLFIVTIPFGVQCFKLAGFALWPFGRAVVKRSGASQSLSVLGNVIWFVFAGVWLALAHLVAAALLALTIIGLPHAAGNLKLVPLALTPFGKDIVTKGSVAARTDAVVF